MLTGSLLLDRLDLFCPDITTTTTTSTSTTTTPLIPCPLLELYGKHSAEVNSLRYVRDEFLSKNPEGREVIKLYYQLSPFIVKLMREDKLFKEELRGMIESIMSVLDEELK